MSEGERIMKFNYIMMMVWGFIATINLASHNWPAAFNAVAVIFCLFVINQMRKEAKEKI